MAMEKKNVLLVMVIILVPIILMGSLAVLGADNIPEEHDEEPAGDEDNDTLPEIIAFDSFVVDAPAYAAVPAQAFA